MRSRTNTRVAAVALAGLSLATLATGAAVAGNGKPQSGSSTGTGQVFFPNPVASLQDQSLTDQGDADYAALAPAYRNVTLTNLDGSGYLVGDWANVVSETGDRAYSPTNTFIYRRNDDRFEQVMAYYWVTETQKYIQSLGFGTGTYAPVNKESQDLRINQWGADNSFSWDKKDMIKLGKGGVDDGEDAEVIIHEYGHAVHDAQVAGFGTSIEAGAIGEAFGDYLAVTVTNVLAPTADAPCVADWDAVSYDPSAPHCLRRIDTNLTYADRRGQVHFDGQIWSRALWDIRNALGATKADTLILQSQFSFAPDTTFAAAADRTIRTAELFRDQRKLSRAEVDAVRKAFTDRGISVTG
ncbi:M36 family metallopeptidase [Nocardioides piscis]|uniref:M36 family metallopeptidase n=1 Tax=Nocardioides piscis TaxID=2714938 RepID=UPI00197E8A7C|nr:M36 family metallopeptidase [Nocardioides piscis]